jgi:hypothetical protein
MSGTLKRNKKGDMILRFRAGGRGSKIEYRNLGPITHGDAKTRADELQVEARGARHQALGPLRDLEAGQGRGPRGQHP